jgi:hypothetical protein
MKTHEKKPGKSIFLGILFILISLVFIYVFGQVTQLKCTKPQINVVRCASEKQLIGLFTISTKTFSDVKSADVQTKCDDEGCTHRVVLMTVEGQQPLTSFYSSGQSSKQNIADQINAYINSSNKRDNLNIQEKSGIWAALFSFAFFLFGMYRIIIYLVNERSKKISGE